jgi:hypothetical protein
MLLRNRNELLFALEERWASFGWELQQAETSSNIRAALRRIQGITCRSLQIFCLKYRRESTLSQLEQALARLKRLSKKQKLAQSNWEKRKENSEATQSALGSTSNPQERLGILALCQESETALAKAFKSLKQTQTRRMLLDEAVLRREAAFAQSELLNFIQIDRYASTPLTFANAMAGLPAIHWRQFMLRCLSFEKPAPCGLTYKRFSIVERVFSSPTANALEAVERMRTRLFQANGQDVGILNELAEYWYFLRRAIETVLDDTSALEEDLPYRIFAEYQRRLGCQNQLDALQAEKETITAPAYVKERSRINQR